MIKVTCYGKTEFWTNRVKALDFYSQAIAGSEGSERERYVNIYMGLSEGRNEVSDED